MKLAIMQPYIFPYIGYFQLVNAVDEFVLLDDVNYINKGWINRNRIAVNGKEHMFTIPLKDASQNKLINEIQIAQNGKWQKKILKTIEMTYKKSPFFHLAFPVIEKIILSNEQQLSKFLLNSIFEVNSYLDIKTPLKDSSSIVKDMNCKGQARILDICIKERADQYVNAIGGAELYSKELFSKNNIRLHFIQSKAIQYRQFQNEFIPWLSIIDVLMFNDVIVIKNFLNEYELI